MPRTINVQITGQFVQKDNKNAGVMGEGNVATLHITCDESWRGYGKRIVWRDANGENPVSIVLFNGDSAPADSLTYDTTIPSEAMALPGWCSFTVEGYNEADGVHKVALSVSDYLYVEESDSYYKPAEPTPSQTQQILEALGKTEEAVKESATEAKSWAVGGTGTRPGEDTDNSKYYAGEAEKSAAEAAGSEQSAEQSAGSAGASATAAASSAGAAASSAAAASQSAASAGDSASNASESERNAAASESAAAGSAAEAKKYEQAAAGSASSASISAGSASGSASAAAGSAGTAFTKASEAAASAAAASASETNAKASENAAKESQSAAKTSETAAAGHANDAEAAQRAIENMTVSSSTLTPEKDVDVEKTIIEGVVNLHYMIPRGEKGEKGDGFKILGYYSDVPSLESGVLSPAVGDAYGVGASDPYDIYIWDGSTWVNNGPIQGPEGKQGPRGESGVYYDSVEPSDPEIKLWIDPAGESDQSIPGVTAADNGKILKVVDGVWTPTLLPVYNGEVQGGA